MKKKYILDKVSTTKVNNGYLFQTVYYQWSRLKPIHKEPTIDKVKTQIN